VKFLASHRWRIFLIAWIVYSVHFATNVVREHYPAFSIAEHGTFRVDEYQGFNSDIFVHRDGHSYIDNQVTVSVIATVPLLIFEPVLDALERYSKHKLAENGVPASEYRTDKPNRKRFFKLVKERGLDLRFGAATVVTSVFLMAPLTALFLVLFYDVLKRRGLPQQESTWLTLLLGFGTPIFFRTSVLNHNQFVMFAMFLSFVLLWVPRDTGFPVLLRNRVSAGFCAGFTLAVDYIGLITLPLLYGYLLFSRLTTASWKTSFRESMAFVAGSIPPVLLLLYTQWAMFGNPLLPAQFWMPKDANVYADLGTRGFDWPAPDLFLKNLFDPGYGMYTWCPLFLLGLVPAIWYASGSLILPRRERRFVIVSLLAVLIFSSANQYARLQWNSGFRYLLPIVPLVFLAVTDHLIRMPNWLRVPLSIVAVLHSWVLTVFRETSVQAAWALFFREGIQLPWFRVLTMTSSPDSPLINSRVPVAILAAMLFSIFVIWRYGHRAESLLHDTAPEKTDTVATVH
jgi:hypothetical protein